MKRYISLVLAVLLIITMTSCSAAREMSDGAPMSEVWSAFKADLFGEKDGNYVQIDPMVFRATSYGKSNRKLGYEQLENEDMRVAYKNIESCIYTVSDDIDGESGSYKTKIASVPNMNSLELYKVKKAVVEDHPEAFWLNGYYTIGYNRTDGDYVSLCSTVPGSLAKTQSKEFEVAVDIFLADIPAQLSEYERELFIHDKLIRNCEYDHAAYDAQNDIRNDEAAFSAYGALVNRRALCGGYSIATKLLLQLVGIDSMTVDGTSDGQGHKWNAVKIDDTWYQLDVTWDDPSATDAWGDIGVKYWYFNLNDANMKLNHVYGEQISDLTNEMVENGETSGFYNFDLPECSSLEHNFLLRESLPISELKYSTQRKINDYMDEVVSAGGELLYFDIDETLSYDEAVAWLAGNAFDRAANLTNSKGIGSMIKAKEVYSVNQSAEAFAWKNIVIIKIIYEE